MANLTEIILTLRSGGLRHALRILRYTLKKERLDRKYLERIPSTPPQIPGKLLDFDPVSGGGCFHFEKARLEIAFLAADLVRISWEPGLPPVPYALDKSEWPEVEVALQESPEGTQLSTAALEVIVRLDGSLTFREPSGPILRQDLPPNRQAESWTGQSILHPEEHLYGLGEQAGPLDLRARTHQLWARDPGGSYSPGSDPIYAPFPVYLGLHRQGSYLVFYENPFPANLAFPQNSPNPPLAAIHFEGGQLRYYFIPGPPDRALERFTELTGRAPLPPLWSLGYHQSRWGYKSEKDIREVVAGFKEHDLPLSAIHLDIDYMDGYRVFTVDPQRFPDLPALIQELEGQGVKTVTIIDPGVKVDPSYEVYRQGLKEGVFCTLQQGRPLEGLVWPGWSVFPDFTNAKARAWWANYYPRLLDAGVAGIWHDMNEPTSFAAWGDLTLPLRAHHNLEGRSGDHRQAHNLYALQMNRTGYQALRSLRPERRPWIISRSGWAGQQRYAWNWTGDSESTWGGLRMTLATVLGMGLSGLAFTGPDIGGFSGSPSAELYLRWFQLATFLPFFRTHSAVGTARREPWVYGEPYTAILRQFLRLRYRLLPYIYTLSWENSQTGAPLVRPVWWNHWGNEALWDVDDAFLLGDSLLVAPTLVENAEIQEVTLPPGFWLDFWEGTSYQGPGKIKLPVSLERIPLFLRAGTVFPMAEDDRLTLHIYGLNDNRSKNEIPAGHLYQDSGDGYGDWRLDEFRLATVANRLELSWTSLGNYPLPFAQVEIQLHSLTARRAWLDGEEVTIRDYHLETGQFRKVQFDLNETH